MGLNALKNGSALTLPKNLYLSSSGPRNCSLNASRIGSSYTGISLYGSSSLFGGRLFIYSSIATATFFAVATASTTVLAPLTASPPAKTPARVVFPSLSTDNKPLLVVSIP